MIDDSYVEADFSLPAYDIMSGSIVQAICDVMLSCQDLVTAGVVGPDTVSCCHDKPVTDDGSSTKRSTSSWENEANLPGNGVGISFFAANYSVSNTLTTAW